MKRSSEATDANIDAVVVPQSRLLRVVYLLNAFLCFAVGGLGGFARTSEACAVWSLVAIAWTICYLWAFTVPYLRVSTDGLTVCSTPFSRVEASIESISTMSFSKTSVQIHQVNRRTFKIQLRRVPIRQRSDLLALLHRIESRVEEKERLDAAAFESTWDIDPSKQQSRDDA